MKVWNAETGLSGGRLKAPRTKRQMLTEAVRLGDRALAKQLTREIADEALKMERK